MTWDRPPWPCQCSHPLPLPQGKEPCRALSGASCAPTCSPWSRWQGTAQRLPCSHAASAQRIRGRGAKSCSGWVSNGACELTDEVQPLPCTPLRPARPADKNCTCYITSHPCPVLCPPTSLPLSQRLKFLKFIHSSPHPSQVLQSPYLGKKEGHHTHLVDDLHRLWLHPSVQEAGKFIVQCSSRRGRAAAGQRDPQLKAGSGS